MKFISDEFPLAKRSASAEMVAVLRAAHQVIDRPVVHTDPLAMQIIGAEGRRWLEANPAMLEVNYVRAIRAMVSIRSRLCEEELARAVARGTTQYVLLGAGLDTFAYRQPDFARDLTIFEVDEPGTQAWKLERLEEAGLALPENLRFVPVDFNTRTLAEGLHAAGFDRSAPTFFAWLGVSYYLPLESILETLRFVVAQDATSEVIFDIVLDEPAIAPDFRAMYGKFRQQMLKAPEPWLTWLDPGPFSATLRELGFTTVEQHDSRDMMERFLAGHFDGLVPGTVLTLIVARKGL